MRRPAALSRWPRKAKKQKAKTCPVDFGQSRCVFRQGKSDEDPDGDRAKEKHKEKETFGF